MATPIGLYYDALHTADIAAETNLARVHTTQHVLSVLEEAVDYIDDIKNDAKDLRQTAKGLEQVTRLVGKVGFLKFLTKPLGDIIHQIETRAQQVENKAADIEWKYVDKLKHDIDTQ